MATKHDPIRVKACLFDAYGTLFDIHGSVEKHRAQLGNKIQQVAEIWRTKQLEYTWLRSLMGCYRDFWQVTSDALDYALNQINVRDPMLRSKLMDGYLRLPPYADVRQSLTGLKNSGLRIAIMSNGAMHMLHSAIRAADLDDCLHKIISVDDAKVYKPHADAYRLGCDWAKAEAEDIAFVSTNPWDVAGAANFGFKSVWLNRFNKQPELLPGTPVAEIFSLSELGTLLIPANQPKATRSA